MITAEIIKYHQHTHIGDNDDDYNIHDECRNTITFDCDSLIINSVKDGVELSTIMFDITPKLIKELKAFVSVIQAQYEE